MAKFTEDRSKSLTGLVIQAEHKKTEHGECIYLYFEDGTYLDIRAFYNSLEISKRRRLD